MERLNAVRNAVAHSFFPENRYQYRTHKKVLYQGLIEGFTLFQDECQSIIDYLVKRAFGV